MSHNLGEDKVDLYRGGGSSYPNQHMTELDFFIKNNSNDRLMPTELRGACILSPQENRLYRNTGNSGAVKLKSIFIFKKDKLIR